MIILNDNSEKREENNDDRGDQSIERSIEELSDLADKLTKEANILVEIEEFDEALDKYDEAIELYKQTNNDSEIEKMFELIEICYDNKSRFLRKAIMENSKEKVKGLFEKLSNLKEGKDALKQVEVDGLVINTEGLTGEAFTSAFYSDLCPSCNKSKPRKKACPHCKFLEDSTEELAYMSLL